MVWGGVHLERSCTLPLYMVEAGSDVLRELSSPLLLKTAACAASQVGRVGGGSGHIHFNWSCSSSSMFLTLVLFARKFAASSADP